MKQSKKESKKSYKLHRKGTIARGIQDWFLSKPWEKIMNGDGWCWYPIGGTYGEYCVAMEWQDGYAGDDFDKECYGPFIDGTWVINVSIKFTDEFSINGEYALYAETYFVEDGADLEGGLSLCVADIEDGFYKTSQYLAETYIFFRGKIGLRRKI